MHMPVHMPMSGSHHKHHGHIMKKKMMWAGVFGILWMVGAALVVLAVSRNASASLIQARLKALKRVPDAFTEEERALIEHKIASAALRGL